MRSANATAGNNRFGMLSCGVAIGHDGCFKFEFIVLFAVFSIDAFVVESVGEDEDLKVE